MLHRKLKKLTGQSARDLIILKRLEKARELLKNDVATASEVAYQVGFNSPSYFSKVFKKHYKISPGDFRKHPEKHVFSSKVKAAGKPSKSKILQKFAWPVLTVGTIMLVYLIINAWNSVPFKERDWIVITDFINQTDESIFDNSLNTAFTLNISQSRYINVVSRQRMLEALKRMKKEDQANIDENTGREIAMREGVDICVVPGISKESFSYLSKCI